MPAVPRKKVHFKRPVVESLAKRAGQRCSYCGLATSGPHADRSKWINVGEAAHIKAEAPGGPRFDPAQTPEERNGIGNGIWLCNKHHKLVDSDSVRFTVEVLLRLRSDHEDRIRREIDSGGSALGASKIFSVPFRRNIFFTGREEMLGKLAKRLKNTGTAAIGQVTAISGLGGIGKTQTAVEFAYLHREEYRAVFFVVAETESDLIGGFAAIARELGLPEAQESDQQKAVAAAKHWLAAEDGWLLILDNADTPELLDPFVPLSPQGHVLVTSRAPSFAAIGAEAEPLKAPSTSEAVAFLLKRTGRTHTNDEEQRAANDIAVELGSLPLALEQAGAYMVAQQASFTDYLAGYRRRGLELLAKGSVEAGTGHDPVAITWSMNITEVEKLSVASADILRAASFLAPNGIPDELFLYGGAKFSESLGKAVEGGDPLTIADLALPLLRYSLVERDPQTRTMNVHRLLQQVVQKSMRDTSEEASSRVASAMKVAFPWPAFETWHRCERLLAHLLVLENSSPETKPLASLLNSAARYLQHRARFKEAEPLYQRSLALLERFCGNNHPHVATLLNNLGVLYVDSGNLAKAEPLHLRALAIREDLNDVQGIAASMNNLAEVYRLQDRLDEAEPLYRHSLAIAERELGIFHPKVSILTNNLAILCGRQGKLTEAEGFYLRTLAIRERNFGADHPNIATVLNNLAGFYARTGSLEKAESLACRSVSILEGSLPEDHPHIATALRNLSLLYKDQNRDQEAADVEKRAEEMMARHSAKNLG